MPPAAAAAASSAFVTSRVYGDLAAITRSLAAMLQQVQVRSRAIFQAGLMACTLLPTLIRKDAAL